MSSIAPLSVRTKPDYGVDGPGAMRNLFVIGALLLILVFITPKQLVLGPIHLWWHYAMAWTAGFLLLEASLFLLYVKVGKFRLRDRMLAMHNWRGDENVLDVGCGRGLLMAGVAKLLPSGHVAGIDIWSNVDMGGNSETATKQNLELEGVADRCTLISAGAQSMPMPDDSFDVVVSNLCLHNIAHRPTRQKAIAEIARVLKPGGVALLSDYRHTGEYAAQLRQLGWAVHRRWGGFVTAFAHLRVVIARKPAA
jgi:arsenite methyltransferase